MDATSFEAELRQVFDQALDAAESSPDVRDEEPFLIRLVALACAHSGHQAVVEDTLIALAAQVATTPHPNGFVELLAYAVYVPRLPRLIAALEEMQETAMAGGRTERPWEGARRYERVLDAQKREWADRDLFPSLLS